MCLGVGLFGSSCLRLSMFPGFGCLFPSPDKGSFQPLFLQISFLPFSLFSHSGTLIMQILVWLMLFQRFLKLTSFFKILFSFCCSDWAISPLPCLPDCRSIFLHHLSCCWFYLVYFYFSYCILQLWLVLFNVFYLFVQDLTVFIHFST